MTWDSDFVNEVTHGMKRHYQKLIKDNAWHKCEQCEFAVGKYPGRYPKTCPNCNCNLTLQANYPRKGSPELTTGDKKAEFLTSSVKSIVKEVDAICESLNCGVKLESITEDKCLFSVTEGRRILGTFKLNVRDLSRFSIREKTESLIDDRDMKRKRLCEGRPMKLSGHTMKGKITPESGAMKQWKSSPNDLTSATYAAAWIARRDNKDCVVVPWMSYMTKTFAIGYASDDLQTWGYLTGKGTHVMLVKPDGTVYQCDALAESFTSGGGMSPMAPGMQTHLPSMSGGGVDVSETDLDEEEADEGVATTMALNKDNDVGQIDQKWQDDEYLAQPEEPDEKDGDDDETVEEASTPPCRLFLQETEHGRKLWVTLPEGTRISAGDPFFPGGIPSDRDHQMESIRRRAAEAVNDYRLGAIYSKPLNTSLLEGRWADDLRYGDVVYYQGKQFQVERTCYNSRKNISVIDTTGARHAFSPREYLSSVARTTMSLPKAVTFLHEGAEPPVEEKTFKVFAYGELADAELRGELFGKDVPFEIAQLDDFVLVNIPQETGDIYPNIHMEKGQKVVGLVLTLNQDELNKADHYEGEHYTRMVYPVQGEQVFLYVLRQPTQESVLVYGEHDVILEKHTPAKEEDVNPTELKWGIKVEMEHTDDPKRAKQIALDHLSEDPKYYHKLKAAGLAPELDERGMVECTFKPRNLVNFVPRSDMLYEAGQPFPDDTYETLGSADGPADAGTDTMPAGFQHPTYNTPPKDDGVREQMGSVDSPAVTPPHTPPTGNFQGSGGLGEREAEVKVGRCVTFTRDGKTYLGQVKQIKGSHALIVGACDPSNNFGWVRLSDVSCSYRYDESWGPKKKDCPNCGTKVDASDMRGDVCRKCANEIDRPSSVPASSKDAARGAKSESSLNEFIIKFPSDADWYSPDGGFSKIWLKSASGVVFFWLRNGKWSRSDFPASETVPGQQISASHPKVREVMRKFFALDEDGKAICAWCGKDLGNREWLKDGDITHGMCKDCHVKVRNDILKSKSKTEAWESSLKEEVLGEGVNDRYILKAVFMLGGGGSGKSAVVGQMIRQADAEDQKTLSGMKFDASMPPPNAMGVKVVNSDDMFEMLSWVPDIRQMLPKLRELPQKIYNLKPASMGGEMGSKDIQNVIRPYARELTALRAKGYIAGRLPLLIDGTGANFSKVQTQVRDLQNLGYDCYCVYVQVDVETAVRRNLKRKRTVEEPTLRQAHSEINANMSGYKSLFGSRFHLVVNNDLDAQSWQKAGTERNSMAQRLFNEPVTNPVGKLWIEVQKELRGISKYVGESLGSDLDECAGKCLDEEMADVVKVDNPAYQGEPTVAKDKGTDEED